LEHALLQNWTKAKGKNGRLSYFLFHRRQQKVVQSFLWVYLFLMENLEETLQWFLNYIFNGNKGGFIVKKMVGKFSFFGYSQWKQKGGGRGGGVAYGKIKPSTLQ
jgi:hypothetical protein